MTMRLAWGSRVPSWFRDRVIRLAREGGFDPSHLMACMKFESNFNPEARNPNSSASGLIQFMESTAEGLDTTIEAIRSMSAMEQLEMVDAYFRPYFGRIHSLSDCYMAILNPASIGLAEDAIIFPAGSRAALANRGLDINHDNAVSKAEAASFVEAALFNGMRAENVFEIDDTQPAAPIEDHSTPLPPTQEKPVGALMFLPAILQMIPQLAGMFGKGGKAEQNQKLAQTVVDVFTAAVPGAVNTQQAVELATANPTTKAAAVAAVLTEPVIEHLLEIGPSELKEARAANFALMQSTTKWWANLVNPVLLVTLATLPLIYIIVWGLVPFLGKVSSDVIAQTIGTVIGLVLGGIMGFWMGQTYRAESKRTSDQPAEVLR